LVPTFLIEKLTAGRLPEGTVDDAIKESAELVARYPTSLIRTIKSGRPKSVVPAGVPFIGYVPVVFSPGVVATGFVGVGVDGCVAVELAVVEIVELAPLKEIVVDAFGTTEREAVERLNTEPR